MTSPARQQHATCSYCNQSMGGDGCTVTTFDDFRDRIARPRLPFEPVAGGPERCRDCNAAPGHLHHPGCCIERCPGCQGQAISCGCSTADDEAAT